MNLPRDVSRKGSGGRVLNAVHPPLNSVTHAVVQGMCSMPGVRRVAGVQAGMPMPKPTRHVVRAAV